MAILSISDQILIARPESGVRSGPGSGLCCWVAGDEPNTCLKLAFRFGIGGAARVDGTGVGWTASLLLRCLGLTARFCSRSSIPPPSSLPTDQDVSDPTASNSLSGCGITPLLCQIDRERVTRCITSRARSGPQCEAMISNRGFGCGVPG